MKQIVICRVQGRKRRYVLTWPRSKALNITGIDILGLLGRDANLESRMHGLEQECRKDGRLRH
jgi:hypothetical protein